MGLFAFAFHDATKGCAVFNAAARGLIIGKTNLAFANLWDDKAYSHRPSKQTSSKTNLFFFLALRTQDIYTWIYNFSI